MTPEHLKEVRALFEATLEQDLTERPAFLRAKCGDNPRLREEVEALLQADAAGSQQLRSAIHSSLEIVDDSPQAPQRIGPYRVLRELGRGGLATVYLAERADQQYEKRVAIKVVRRGMDTEDLLQRLRQERQFLADLDHPNIARFLGGGTAQDGRPYLVMEHIDGEPVDRYCDRHRLSIEARLELFRQVCAAVQAAHATSLIHRDIKPGNILVTADGTPKLLDFGIAKLLVPDHEVAAFTQTATGMRLLTPAYASPEQIRGERLALQSDVYSLGVVLYQLLSGHRPYLFPSRSSTDIERIICEVEPPPPSSSVGKVEESRGKEQTETLLTPETVSAARGLEPEKLRRRLRGDLDTIVAKSMHKDRARRYASVEQLSEDLGRHLSGLPVLARPDTLGYQTGKFIGRHRLGLSAVLGVFLLIGALVAYYTHQLRDEWERANQERDRANQERDRANQERDRANQEAETSKTARELMTVFDPDILKGALSAVAPIVLDYWAQQLENSEPPVQAILLYDLGESYKNLRSYSKAEETIQAAVELQQELYGRGDIRVADTQNQLGEVQYYLEEDEKAAYNFGAALKIRREHLDEYHPDILSSLNNLAAVERRRNNLEKSEQLFREILDKRLQLLEPGDPQIGGAANNLASVLSKMGRYTEAEPLYQEALTLKRAEYGEEHLSTAKTIANLGNLYRKMELYPKAVEYLERAHGIYVQLLGEEHLEVLPVTNLLAEAKVALAATHGSSEGEAQRPEPHEEETRLPL